MTEAWFGQLTDGRVLQSTDDLPADAPSSPRWKHVWHCFMRGRALTCGAPKGVFCRCAEVLRVS